MKKVYACTVTGALLIAITFGPSIKSSYMQNGSPNVVAYEKQTIKVCNSSQSTPTIVLFTRGLNKLISSKSTVLNKGDILKQGETVQVAADGFVSLLSADSIISNIQPRTLATLTCNGSALNTGHYFISEAFRTAAVRG